MPRGKQRSVSADRFAMVPRNDVPRSAFDMSHTHKTTFDAGQLIPVFIQEVLPGDSMRLNMTALCRLATPIVPIMDNIHLESFFFFCSNRLVWDNWQRFMGEQIDPTDTTEFLVPQVPVSEGESAQVGGLADYFGITHAQNLAGGVPHNVNALPFRMYNLIWNEWFRDEDLQPSRSVPRDDGPDDITADEYQLAFRGKRHDYFTSARPWPQKPSNVNTTGGMDGAGPFIPGGAYAFPDAGAPVTGLGVSTDETAHADVALIRNSGNRDVTFNRQFNTVQDTFWMNAQPVGDYPNVRVLINDIRTANQIQLLLERNARGGTRYTEIIRSHFGVLSPDARLQRPEYLGGGHSMVQITPIAQTAPTGVAGTTTVMGELAAVATAVAHNHGFSQSFTEHGFVLGFVCTRADITYQQGVNRLWHRRGRFDYYWPALAHLGEQAIFSREIYAAGNAGDEDVFGYQERWAEYRHMPNRISGGFRSTATGVFGTAIDQWHLAQEFSARPVLNPAFIVENPPMDRVLQVDTTIGFQFLFDSVFNLRMVRALPMFSIPGMGPRL